jgi:hypothetical protein
MCATRIYGSGNFYNDFRWIEQMFQHVLGDHQIKEVVGKFLIFQVFARNPWVTVVYCLFLGRSTTRRRFMDSVTTPLRRMGVQVMNDCALSGYARTTKAPEVFT